MAADHMGKGRHLRQLENLVYTKGEAIVENQERNGGGLSKGNASRDE